jgi:hypothetical protein
MKMHVFCLFVFFSLVFFHKTNKQSTPLPRQETPQMATRITRTEETNRNNQSTPLPQAEDTPNGNNNDSSQNNQ